MVLRGPPTSDSYSRCLPNEGTPSFPFPGPSPTGRTFSGGAAPPFPRIRRGGGGGGGDGAGQAVQPQRGRGFRRLAGGRPRPSDGASRCRLSLKCCSHISSLHHRSRLVLWSAPIDNPRSSSTPGDSTSTPSWPWYVPQGRYSSGHSRNDGSTEVCTSNWCDIF